jgi:hypothetical protein
MNLAQIREYEAQIERMASQNPYFQLLLGALAWYLFIVGAPWGGPRHEQIWWPFFWGLMAIWQISDSVRLFMIRESAAKDEEIKKAIEDGTLTKELKEFHAKLHGVSGCSKSRSMRRRILICHRNYKMRR